MEELRIEANGNLGPIDSARIPRYAGAATYARLPRLDQVAKVDVTVVGVPFDSGVSYRPAPASAPTTCVKPAVCCARTTRPGTSAPLRTSRLPTPATWP
ncbi:guanidinobutyrase [Arthrobacter sp. Hiyo8]|nr:guanidinobutyrase [Arthrobacter sp. Hiyo8]